MFEVMNVFKIGYNLSVTLGGCCESIKNGSRLVDKDGNVYDVLSVGMTSYGNPSDISSETTVLIVPCSLTKGTLLYKAE